MSDVKVMRLRYAGTCACGRGLAQVTGRHTTEARSASSACTVTKDRRTIRHQRLSRKLWPPRLRPSMWVSPVLGALREYERRKAKDDAARAERSRVWRALNTFF